MKKILVLLAVIILSMNICKCANAACMQCPEIQKLIKKEFKKEDIKLSKSQKNEIKKVKNDMKSLMKDYDKKLKENKKNIDKILKADCPDIVKMMELKNESAKIKKDKSVSKREYYDNLFYIYTPEQQYVAKRVLSENSTIETKKPCDFCEDFKKLKPNCKKCNNK